MSNIFIFSDITCDFPKQRYRNNMEILPFSCFVGDDSYDNIETFIDIKKFYERQKSGEKVGTSMLNQYLLEERVTAILEKGFDVLYLVFSSALSGTYEIARKSFEMLKEKYPQRKIEAIDSRNASLGEGLILENVLTKRDEGVSMEELVEHTLYYRDHVCSYFTVMDLKHLASLGRVSKTQAFIGTIAKIMPVMYCNELGQLVPIEKVITRKKALKALVDKMEEKMLPIEQQSVIFIGHGNCLEDAEYVADLVRERLGIKNIVIDYVGQVIGAHSGQGTVALFFVGKDRREAKDANVAK